MAAGIWGEVTAGAGDQSELDPLVEVDALSAAFGDSVGLLSALVSALVVSLPLDDSEDDDAESERDDDRASFR